MAHLQELHAKHAEAGLVIVGVHTLRAADKAPEFVKAQGIGYRVAIDRDRGLNEEATGGMYRVDAYPDYYLIDRKGNLRFADLANAEVDRAIAYLLAEKP